MISKLPYAKMGYAGGKKLFDNTLSTWRSLTLADSITGDVKWIDNPLSDTTGTISLLGYVLNNTGKQISESVYKTTLKLIEFPSNYSNLKFYSNPTVGSSIFPLTTTFTSSQFNANGTIQNPTFRFDGNSLFLTEGLAGNIYFYNILISYTKS